MQVEIICKHGTQSKTLQMISFGAVHICGTIKKNRTEEGVWVGGGWVLG